MGSMVRFIVGLAMVGAALLMWMLAVQIGAQIADGLRQALP